VNIRGKYKLTAPICHGSDIFKKSISPEDNEHEKQKIQRRQDHYFFDDDRDGHADQGEQQAHWLNSGTWSAKKPIANNGKIRSAGSEK
jgi:hypothetical protein